jgi:hypothetical protein
LLKRVSRHQNTGGWEEKSLSEADMNGLDPSTLDIQAELFKAKVQAQV